MNSRLAGFSASLFLHTGLVALFILFGKVDDSPVSLPAAQAVVSIAISQFTAPEPVALEPEEPVTEPAPDNVVKKIPEPSPEAAVVPRKEVIKKIKPAKKIVQPRPASTPAVVEPEPEIEFPDPSEVVTEVSTQSESSETPVSPESPVSEPTNIPSVEDVAIEEHYKAGIRAAILKNKAYPRQAKRKKQQGTVVLRFRVLPDGAVKNLIVTKGSGYKSLDVAAIKAVNKVKKFDAFPAGIKKAFWEFEIPVSFRIR